MQKEERREKPIARMEKGINGKTRLMVDGKPFFVLGGEIHNSTASGEAYMEEYVWKQLPGKHLNTLLVPICWELVEKEQGRLDFAIPRRVIDRARQEGIRLIFLWFGLWKNGASHYAPAWVLKESGTYFRARGRDRLPSSTISPLCEIAVEADARAFSAFMAFLREYDQEERTVIMVQVENEVGFLGGNRDYSEAAVEAYAKEVPPELAEAFGVEGSWKQAFGERAEDYFMAWYFARAVERIAVGGKEEYPLPMYANVWLEAFPYRPGDYPTGGPTARMIQVWKLAAPSIDLLSPDIYDPDFFGCCDPYAQANALFIPETVRQPVAASNVLGMLGLYDSIGYSLFGIDDLWNAQRYDTMRLEEKDALRIDWRWDRCSEATISYIDGAYQLIVSLWELYLERQDSCLGFARRGAYDRGAVLRFGRYDVILTYPQEGEEKAGSAGFLLPAEEESFYLAGCNAVVTVRPALGEEGEAQLLGVWEGAFVNGKFEEGRKLNGDELYAQCRLGDIPSVIKIEVGMVEV